MFFLFICTEFSNCISDIIMAAALWFLYLKIVNFKVTNTFTGIWKQYFFLTGLTGLLGAIGHFLFDYIGIPIKMGAWISAIVALFLLEKKTAENLNLPKYLTIIFFTKCLIFLGLAIYFQAFPYIKTAISIGIIGFVAPTLFYKYKKTSNNGYLILMLCLLANGLGGIAHAVNLQPTPWCNGGDVAHIITCFCFWGMYLGLEKIGIVHATEQEIKHHDELISSN